MVARIYKPTQNAMQSGASRLKYHWMLEFEPASARQIDPLMGWTGSGDTRKQVSLAFDTKEEAIAYAEREGLPYQVFEPKTPKRRRMSYADNFRWGRIGQWTH